MVSKREREKSGEGGRFRGEREGGEHRESKRQRCERARDSDVREQETAM